MSLEEKYFPFVINILKVGIDEPGLGSEIWADEKVAKRTIVNKDRNIYFILSALSLMLV